VISFEDGGVVSRAGSIQRKHDNCTSNDGSHETTPISKQTRCVKGIERGFGADVPKRDGESGWPGARAPIGASDRPEKLRRLRSRWDSATVFCCIEASPAHGPRSVADHVSRTPRWAASPFGKEVPAVSIGDVVAWRPQGGEHDEHPEHVMTRELGGKHEAPERPRRMHKEQHHLFPQRRKASDLLGDAFPAHPVSVAGGVVSAGLASPGLHSGQDADGYDDRHDQLAQRRHVQPPTQEHERCRDEQPSRPRATHAPSLPLAGRCG
jgi:hypothetical protein